MANDSEILLLAIEQALDEHRRQGGLRGRSYHTALVLLAAAGLGPSVKLIAEDLDLEEPFVQTIAGRMRASRLWDNVRVSTEVGSTTSPSPVSMRTWQLPKGFAFA